MMCFNISIFISLLFVKQIIRTNPDVECWSHVLSWNRPYGSGAPRSNWTGWMVDFLLAGKLKSDHWILVYAGFPKSER